MIRQDRITQETTHRIQIARRTTWERLLSQIRERGDEPVLVVGVGERARRLLDRLARDMPGVIRSLHISEDREHEAFVNFHADDWPNVPRDGTFWLSKTRGQPPVVNRLKPASQS